jgi:hypothetical protein
MGYFRILAAIPGFFISALLLMALWSPIAPKIGVTGDLGYVDSMLVTIVIWLVVAPLATAGRRKK